MMSFMRSSGSLTAVECISKVGRGSCIQVQSANNVNVYDVVRFYMFVFVMVSTRSSVDKGQCRRYAGNA